VKLGGMGWNCVNMGEMAVKAPLRGAGWRGWRGGQVRERAVSVENEWSWVDYFSINS
jgi:hypothetical protein